MTRLEAQIAHCIGRAEAEMNMGPLRNKLRQEGFTIAVEAVIRALTWCNPALNVEKFREAICKE